MRKLGFLLIIAMLLTFCGAANAADKLQIVCTSFPCYDFARAVAGDAAEIRLLIKPGAEVHSYEPTPADVMAIAGCDLFVYVGGKSDAWVETILDSLGGDAPRTLRFFDCVEAIEAEEKEGMTLSDHAHNHEYDEHIWTSPMNAIAMVKAMDEALGEIVPEQAEAFFANQQAYTAEIAAIDTEIRGIVESGARREMIFADRFPFLYFAREYGIDYHAAFPSCAAESEPSAKTLAFLIERIIRDKVPVIYIIELSSGKTGKTLSEETGAKVLEFHSIQNVTEADFSAGETYLTLMRRNVEALREGLN